MRFGPHILLAMRYYYPEIHRGVARFASRAGWHLNSQMVITGNMPRGWTGDGAIVQGLKDAEYREFAAGLSIPKISLGKDVKLGCPYVADDCVAIGNAAAEYYLGKGFKTFAVYAETAKRLPPELTCFRDRVETLGHDCSVLHASKTRAKWHERAKDLATQLKSLPKPLAVFAHRDNGGAEVIDACIAHDIKVPTDVAILGKHNDELVCQALGIPLSSVDNNLERMGYMAAELLQRRLQGEDVPEETLVPIRGVVTRASTDILAVQSDKVRRALTYIHANFKLPISLAQIAKVAGISVRGLQIAFRKEINCTINEEIIRLRLESAKKLLIETNCTIETVAFESGFSSLRNFNKLFKKNTHSTPKQYRLTNAGQPRKQ